VEFTYRWDEEEAAIAERAVATSLVDWDPEAAVALVQSQSDPQDPWKQQNLLIAVAEAVARTDAERAIALAETLADQGWRDGAMRRVISVIAEADPEQALSLLPRIRDPNIAKWVEPDVARGFARRDLPRALQMARKMKDLQQDEALMGISCELAATDPAAALQVLHEIRGLPYRETAAYHIAKVIEQTGPADASKIAQGILDEAPCYLPAASIALRIIATANPDTALQMAVRHPYLGDYAKMAASEAVAKHDLDGALSIVEQIDNDVVRSEAFAAVARVRARVDPEGGIGLASTIKDPIDRDSALATIACELADDDARLAVATSERLTDGPLRAATLCQLALKTAGRQMPMPDEVP
jgi:hypothetical protein